MVGSLLLPMYSCKYLLSQMVPMLELWDGVRVRVG